MTKATDAMFAALTPLIEKALHCEGIAKTGGDYDDYFQTLNLTLLRWLRKYPEREVHEWEGFLFNHFRWTIRNLRVKNLRYVKLQEHLAAEIFEDSYTLDSELDMKAVLVKLNPKLSDDERRFLKQRLKGQTITDIAQCSKVSRPTVYKWKKQVQKKYEEITN